MNSKMKELEEARQLAEEAVENLHGKLEVAEEERRKAAEAVEAAKNRTRNMKMPIGLAKPLQVFTYFLIILLFLHLIDRGSSEILI